MRLILAISGCALAVSPAIADVAQTCPTATGLTCVANGLDVACQVDPRFGPVVVQLATPGGDGALVTRPMTRTADCTYVGQTTDGRYRVEAISESGRVVGQLTRGFSTEPAVPRPATPPVSALRVAGEVAGGATVALVGGALGGAVGYLLFCKLDDCSGTDGYEALGAVLIPGAVGAIVTFPLGVYLAGSIGPRGGSLLTTYMGAILGALVATPFLAAGDATTAVGVVSLPLGAIVGFELSRRWDRAEPRAPTGALLELQHGTLTVGIPIAVHDRVREATFVSVAAGAF